MENQEEIRKNIASNISNYRKLYGLTQSELAEKLNYSDKSVSKWERGESVPDVFTLKELANFFNITIEDFFSNKPVTQKKKVRKKRIIIIPLLAIVIAWLVIATLFSVSVMFFPKIPYPWLLYIYAIPITGIILTIFMAIYHDRFMIMISESIIVWGAGFSAFVTSLVFNVPNSFLFLIVCIPLQILALLYYLLKTEKSFLRKLFKKKNKTSTEVIEQNKDEKSDN